MAYIYEYGMTVKPRKTTIIKVKHYIAIGLLALIILLGFCFPGQVRDARKVLFPFLEPNVTEAFGDMLSQIEAGEEVSDAAKAFCEQVIFYDANQDSI